MRGRVWGRVCGRGHVWGPGEGVLGSGIGRVWGVKVYVSLNRRGRVRVRMRERVRIR